MFQPCLCIYSILLLTVVSCLDTNIHQDAVYTTTIELAMTCTYPPINEDSYTQFKQSLDSTINDLIIINSPLSKIQSISIPQSYPDQCEYLISIKVKQPLIILPQFVCHLVYS